MEPFDGVELFYGLIRDDLLGIIESEQGVFDEKRIITEGCRRRLAAMG